MPAYGKVKVDTITYDLSGTATDVSVSNIATKASPTFTGTVTVPTASANDNTTKAASTAYVQTELGDYALKAGPTFTGTVNAADLVLSGDLTVNGSTTTIDTTTLQVEDKNIQIGKVSTPSDVTADGGGLTLLGATNKTWNWVNSTDAWTSSEHIHLPDNKKLFIGTSAQDLSIYHDSTNSYIDSNQGSLLIRGADGIIKIRANNNEESIVCNPNAAVEAYHNGVKKLETSATGCTVTGTLAATAVTGDGSGLTNLPPAGNTVDLVADGAIAAGKPVIIKSNGKVAQVGESPSARTNVAAGTSISDVDTDTNLDQVSSVWMAQHRMLTVIWTDSADFLYARTYKFDSSWNVTTGSIQTLSSNTCRSIQSSYDTQQDRVMVACVVVRSGNYHLEAMVGTPSTSNTNIGSWTNLVNNRIVTGSGNTAEALALFYETTSQKHVFIYRKNPSSGAPGADWDTYSRVISLSGDTFTINSETTLDADDMTQVDICRVDGSKVAVSMRMNSGSSSGTGYARIGTIGSTTMTWGSRVDFTGGGSSVISYDPERATSIIYDTANSKLFVGWIHASNKRAYSVVGSVSGTTLSMDTGTWLDITGGANGNSESWMRLTRDSYGGGIYAYWTQGNQGDRVYAAKITYNASASNSAHSERGSATQVDYNIDNQNSNKNISPASEGYVFLAANDVNLGNHFDIYKTLVANVATNFSSDQRNFLGFAEDAISDGNTGTITLAGNIVGNQSGLTPGLLYKTNNNGTLTQSWGNGEVGLLAIASDKGQVVRSLQ